MHLFSLVVAEGREGGGCQLQTQRKLTAPSVMSLGCKFIFYFVV